MLVNCVIFICAVNVAAPESIGPTPESSGRAARRASGSISDAYDHESID